MPPPPPPPNPLASLSSLLESNTPHLQSLHHLIALPEEQLALDLHRIEDAVRAEMEAIISERTAEVEDWRSRVEGMRKECVFIGRALGGVVDLSGWMRGEEILPKRFALLETYRDQELLPVYQARIEEVKALNSRLSTLTKILPSSFSLAPSYVLPLHPKGRVLSTSSSTAAQPSTTTTTTHRALGLGVPSTAASKPKLPSSASMEDLEGAASVWEDASESRIGELKSLVEKGEQERLSLLSHLRTLLFSLLDILPEVDLSIPLPYPLPSPSSFSSQPSTPLSPSPARPTPPPPQSEEERGYYAVVEGLCNWADTLPEEVDPRDLEEGGLEGVEPGEGLLGWVEGVTEKIRALKSHREQQIQQIYDDLEPLWCRLNVDPEHINEFVEANRGSSEATVKNYQTELSRMLALKIEFMEVFVTGVRKEIVELQNELMLGEEEREAFGAFWDYNYSDELLLAHENECSRLQEEADSKRELLKTVAKWRSIDAEERELLEASKDPSRLTGRGRPGQMLQEERARKRVEQLKPKLEHDLLVSLPRWEEENSRAFMVNGERVLEVIQAGIDAKEAEREARKRSRSGPSSTSTSSAASRSQTPSARSHTPSSRTQAQTPSLSSTVKRKDAPTPLAFTAKAFKRVTPSSIARPTPRSTTASATPGLTACRLPQPRTTSNSTTSSHTLSSYSSGTASSSSSGPVLGSSARGEGSWNVFGAGAGRSVSGMSSVSGKSGLGMKVRPNPRRESFKPRMSVVGRGGGGGAGLPTYTEGWSSPVEESDEVF
ncbi:microtubule associated protein-domain-containing protein [Mrakia frigida]|uniref:Ase1p n=1 Tax=Mrakia frigida TaxID=29902 RepID=UPI003FCBF970